MALSFALVIVIIAGAVYLEIFQVHPINDVGSGPNFFFVSGSLASHNGTNGALSIKVLDSARTPITSIIVASSILSANITSFVFLSDGKNLTISSATPLPVNDMATGGSTTAPVVQGQTYEVTIVAFFSNGTNQIQQLNFQASEQ